MVTQNRYDLGDMSYEGLSTDQKPTKDVPVNALFLEMDTLDLFYFDGTEWQPFGGM